MLRASLLLCLLPLLVGAGASAETPDPYLLLARERALAAQTQIDSPRAAAALIRLHHLRDEVEDLSLLAQTDNDVLAHSHEPLNRVLAKELLMEIERARGDVGKAETLRNELGFLHDFYVVGGFDNEGRAGCARDFGPEATVNDPFTAGHPSAAGLGLKSVYSGVGRDVGWRILSANPLDGRVDLSGAIQPARQTVAYALTFLPSKSGGPVTLALGASGGHKLWVDGALVSTAEGEHPARPDQVRVRVNLRPGLNPVLLKICHDEGPLAFYLRNEEGTAKVTLPTTLPGPVRGAAVSAHVLPTLTSLLATLSKAHPDDALLLADQATVLGYVRPYDLRDRLAAAVAERAAKLAPQNVAIQLEAAQLEEDDPNIRREHLDQALRALPTEPDGTVSPQRARVLLAWAHHELSRSFPDRARELLEQALQAAHPFPAAALELAHVDEELGDGPGSDARFEDAFQHYPRLPRAVREAARMSRRMERLGEAVTRYQAALALRFDDTESRQLLAGSLGDMGRVEEAMQQLTLLAQTTPFDPEPYLRLGELAAANRRAEDSAHAFDRARALAPDQPEVHEREARALLDAGKRPEAIRAFEEALTLRPQNPGLREVLRSLKNEHALYGAEFLLNPLTLSKEADKYRGEDAVILADITHIRVQVSGLSSHLHQLAVKVFNDRGVDSFRSYPISYSPNRQEVRVLRARVTKPDGSVVESHSENERAMNEPWSGMYYDARAKILSFPALAKGDVLDLQYTLDDTAQENLLSDYFGDVEYVQSTAPKLRYALLVDMPTGRTLYSNRATLPASLKSREQKLSDGRTLYRFESSEVPRVLPEPGMPGWGEVVTALHVSTYKTWDEVGRYYWGLVRGQLVHSDELKQTVESALKGIDRKDTQAVVRALYDFVVTETRYVALEFGIHGYQPYRVDRILARRFGDCKDKASLLSTMLAEAGVDSRLVLLRMRNLGRLPEEPASLAAFNHAIVYVPALDTYLDGTAEFHGARELPSVDHLANVLVVEPSGNSRYVITPEARAEDNVTTMNLQVVLHPDGSAAVTGESSVIGLTAPEYRHSYRTPSTRKATFEQSWAQVFPGLKVEQLSINDVSKIEEDVSLKYTLNVRRYSEVLPAGLRFFPFGTSRAYTQSYAPLMSRKFDLLIDHPWTNRFVVDYTLPAGMDPEAWPAETSEETPFGRYRLVLQRDGNRLHCEGEVVMNLSRVKAHDYGEFRAFLARLDQTFARRLVLHRHASTARGLPAGAEATR